MLLPVTGSPLHDCWMTIKMTAASPARDQAASAPTRKRLPDISHLFLSRPWLSMPGHVRYHPTKDPPLTLTVWPVM